MKYAITFQRNTARYAVHALTCSAAKQTGTQARIEFNGTVDEAVEWCHMDESDKTGRPVKAAVKVCGCCK
jgi:hypothetical protein